MQFTFGSDNQTEVEGFTNFDQAGNPNNRKLTLGYVFTYGGGAISWRSKLQDCTTILTIETNYITASKAAKDAIWMF